MKANTSWLSSYLVSIYLPIYLSIYPSPSIFLPNACIHINICAQCMPKYAEHISCFIIFHLWSALARFTPSFLPATRSFCAVDLPTFLGRDQSSLISTPPDYSLKTLPGVPDRFLSRKHAASAKLSWQQSSPFVAHLEYLSNKVGGYTVYIYICIYLYTDILLVENQWRFFLNMGTPKHWFSHS